MRFLNNDPKNKKPQDNKPQNGDDGRQGRRIIFLMVAALIATLLINSLYTTIANAYLSEITYNEFQTYLDKDEIAELEFQSDRMVILTRDEAKKPSSQQRLYYTGYIPNVSNDDLKARLDAQGVEYNTEIVEQASPIVTFVVTWLLPVIIMYALFSLLMRGMTKRMGGGIGGIGESKAKVYMEKSTGITFADVAGQDEAKESLVEIIDFLHNPQKYAAIGAKLPKGALLVGPPGTGKTLLAKAVAGEASVPFFSISGSDFVEMFVGVGASRVRDLFQQAAKVAPAIIFIDEIDAIGRTRDSKFGGNDEREQTLNQLLAEIDGFDSSKGVVILAATNRPEILDKALLRAGRFDRRIIVDRPNLAGRYQTLRVHTKNIKLAEDVDLHKIAQATAGFSTATIMISTPGSATAASILRLQRFPPVLAAAAHRCTRMRWPPSCRRGTHWGKVRSAGSKSWQRSRLFRSWNPPIMTCAVRFMQSRPGQTSALRRRMIMPLSPWSGRDWA